ncbi:hypothetical protein [Natrinema longum]|uniref:Uncharacterized protein n=1 Tax=Natrinema longum TaxID=370324 RepID=A0A8A2UDB0_9EURY|nr:hypothetical protein [Natrinema longum]MBZ6495466.1 hypothetical protein [Natrinema longum]QSW86564.1 hypothetical protein J0X27_07040 [Natrinema longum]
MYMAASEHRSRSVQLETVEVRLEPVESVGADATVRHIDQLGSGTLAAVYRAAATDRTVSVAETELEPGEVIVATDYYRVEPV